MILVRKMNAEDVEKVYSLGNREQTFEAGGSGKIFWSLEQLKNWLKSNDILLVAEENGKIVGFLLTQFHNPTGKMVIENLYVDVDYRKMGVGGNLVSAFLGYLPSMGVEYICALIEEENKIIAKLLEKNGFKKGKKMFWMDKTI